MLLYGFGGHAKAIISSLLANGSSVDAIFDDNPTITNTLSGTIPQEYNVSKFPEQSLIISIGDNFIRRKIVSCVEHRFGKTIHPSALLETTVSVEAGSVILHRCVVQGNVNIGRHVIINTASVIEHDCVIADFVHIAPGAVLCGNVRVRENTLIGSGSIVLPNIQIGKNCLVSAGSVVTKDIPDGAIVRGNPARIIKIIATL